MEVLWLTEDDVKSILTMDEAIAAVKGAFLDHANSKTQMPSKSYLYFTQYDGDLRTMPAYLQGLDVAGVKIVNVHAKNPSIGLPTVMALLTLVSPKTGAPLAIMGATNLTAMRTGAAGAVAAKLLARKDSRIVGMIGAGVQAKTQLLGLSRQFEIEAVSIFDASLSQSESFIRDCRDFLDCEYRKASKPEDACRCDILVTTTPSRSPVVRREWVLSGTHINAIGADAKGKQELESALVKSSKVFVDDMAQAVHSGEVNVPISSGVILPEDIHSQLGNVLAGKNSGRENDQEITIFDSTGLAIQDVATGWRVYEKAALIGKGLKIFPF
jgi:alanine dehydrogenase